MLTLMPASQRPKHHLIPEKIILKGKTRLGRQAEMVDVVINSNHSLLISRLHATITRNESGYFSIENHGLNGLLVNSKCIKSCNLSHGDIIVFGGAGNGAVVGQEVQSTLSELVYRFCQYTLGEASCTVDSPTVHLVDDDIDQYVGEQAQTVMHSKRKRANSQDSSTSTEKKSLEKESSNYNQDSLSDLIDFVCENTSLDSQKKQDDNNNEKQSHNEENFSKIGEEFTCSICQSLLVAAHLLPCSHSFCKECIYTWLSNHSTCPTCRKRSRLSQLVAEKVVDNAIAVMAEKFLNEGELADWKSRWNDVSKFNLKSLSGKENAHKRPIARRQEEYEIIGCNCAVKLNACIEMKNLFFIRSLLALHNLSEMTSYFIRRL
ncbi:uncharacterized protein TRIADDRAFT_61874 [Trichoplax adhaerens]|uniref:E3 ubiquitin-protein ligase CHFR n=1 Tax=Trichoplax adhaerens TaxID=10228 RepID=B3SC84_TRIAD|nr:predicted protein [Trichoplax adhaerens]EDV19677.1 predicted protein [Trichoplax adhaerens]|eukprot:XP_002117834.1 predicted protein [Trichoplax adhaerens]